MKHASIVLLALGLFGLCFAACAEGDESQFGNQPSGGANGEGGAGGGVAMPTSSSSGSVTASSSSTGGGACMAACSSDADCTNNCAVPPQGINCCDTSVSLCYVSLSMCPAPGSSSSGGIYP